MESLLNLDSWMSTTQSDKSDGTKSRTIENIRKPYMIKFNNNVRTSTVNNYSGSRMTLNSKRTESNSNIKGVYQTNGDARVNAFTINGTTENKIIPWS